MGCGSSKRSNTVVAEPLSASYKEALEKGGTAYPSYPNELATSKSIVARVLSEQLFEKLRVRTSKMGVSILDVIKPALCSEDGDYGLIAGDSSCFDESVFRSLYVKVIEEKTGRSLTQGAYPAAQEPVLTVKDYVNPLTELDYVQMIRFEADRNLTDHKFVQCLDKKEALRVQDAVLKLLTSRADDFDGHFESVSDLSPAEYSLFQALGYVPFRRGEEEHSSHLEGRGVFVTENRDLAVIVNYRNHVRVVTQCVRSWEDGRFIYGVCNRPTSGCQASSEYERLLDAVNKLFKGVPVAADSELGFLSGDLADVGTSLRGEFGIVPPKLLKALANANEREAVESKLSAICEKRRQRWKQVATRHDEQHIHVSFESTIMLSPEESVQALLASVKDIIDLDQQWGNTPEEAENEKLIKELEEELLAQQKEEMDVADSIRAQLTPELSQAEKSPVLECLHFNDVYNIEERAKEPIGGAARFIGKIKELKKENDDMLVFFSGDAFNPSMISTFAKGKQMVPVLNAADIHSAVFGNHDFDFGLEALVSFTKETNFPWLLSNVLDKVTGEPLCNGKSHLVFDWQGHRVGLIGLVEREWLVTLACIHEDAVDYVDYVEMGNKLAKKLREEEGVDLVIALTHMRVPNDRRLAEESSGIDLILGGHDHHYEVFETNGVAVVKSGTDFRNLTRIRISYAGNGHNNGRKYKFGTEKIDITSSCPVDADMKAHVDMYYGKLVKEMESIIGETSVPLDGRSAVVRSKESNLGNLICDIMRGSTQADIAWMNAGTLRSDAIHGPGPLRLKDLVDILPMLDEMAVVEVTARQLLEIAEIGVSQYPKLEGRFPQVSGVRFDFDSEQPEGRRVIPGSMKVGDITVDETLDRTFTVVTKGYLLRGKDGYNTFKDARVIVPEESAGVLPTIIKDVFRALKSVEDGVSLKEGADDYGFDHAVGVVERLREYLQYPVAPRVEGRIVNVRDENTSAGTGQI